VLDGDVVLAVFSQAFKVDQAVLAVWVRLLLQVPHAKLWILRHNARSERPLRLAIRRLTLAAVEAANASSALGRDLVQAGEAVADDIDERVLFTDLIERRVELETKALADVLLDTALFGCHTTGAEGLWAGLPLLTAPGRALASRVAASLALAARSGTTVARGLDDYHDLAAALIAGQRRLHLQTLRARIARGRTGGGDVGRREGGDGEGSAGLWRVDEFTRGWEVAMKLMWEVVVSEGGVSDGEDVPPGESAGEVGPGRGAPQLSVSCLPSLGASPAPR
jgi:predicted O-linked N-acetylglucosamine transferase (SPINDLY family)